MSSGKIFPESTISGEPRYNQGKITTDKNGNTFKPKINLQLGNAGRGGDIRLVGVANGDGKNPRVFGASNQTTQQRLVLVNHDVQKESSSADFMEEDFDSDPDCKIERKPSKKVSALISKFNNVVTSARPPRKCSDPKIPNKKLKIDANSGLQSRAEALSNKMDTDSEQSKVERSEFVTQLNPGYVQLPQAVTLNVKLHKEGNEGKLNGQLEVNHVKSNEIHCCTPHEDGSSRRGVEDVKPKPKPAVKPRYQTPVNTVNSKDKEHQPAAMRDSIKQDSSNVTNYHRPLTRTLGVTGNVNVINSARVNKSIFAVNKSAKGATVSQSESSVINEDMSQPSSSSFLEQRNPDGDNRMPASVDVSTEGSANKNNIARDSTAQKIKMPETAEKMEKAAPNQNISESKSLSTSPIISKRDDVHSTCDTMSVKTGNDVKCTELLPSQGRQRPPPLKGSKLVSVSEKNRISESYKHHVSDNSSKFPDTLLTDTRSQNCSQMGNASKLDKTKEPKNVPEDSCEVECSKTEYSKASDRINNALNTLKSELMAMKEQDLDLLKQLINISQRIQLMQRSRVLRVSKSLSFSSVHLVPNKPLQRRYRPVERQNSAPHTVENKRMLYRASTEEIGGSLSSFDDSEFDSQSELEESTTSLNYTHPNSPKSPRPRQPLQARRSNSDVTLSLDVAEDTNQTYEDILRRNVKLWKMSLQNRESVIEEVAHLL